MINERHINICANEQTNDGVRGGLMDTFNKDNDILGKIINGCLDS